MKRFLMRPLSIYFLLSILFTYNLWAQEIETNWQPREDLNVTLPPSVRVYEGSGSLKDSSRYRAVYATVDLRDENLKLRAIGSNTHRETTQETSRKNNGILAINGGYFSSNNSVSLLVSDGEVISPGLTHGHNRGAFGIISGKPDVFYTRSKDAQSLPQVFPQAGTKEGGKALDASLAVGAGPVVVQNGKVNVTAAEEGFGGSHVLRHPRSAIGYIDEHTLVLMVVDGRQKASAGVTLPELGQLMHSVGAVEAVNLDGGGSSAMVAAQEVVNIPTDIPNGNRNSLRNNASALVLSEIVPSAPHETYYLDTEGENYKEIGIWKDSNLPNYYGNSPSRYASATTATNRAIYTFKGLPRKKYQLAAWWSVHEDNASNVAYVLHQDNRKDSIYTNHANLSNSGKWNILGSFDLGPQDSLEIVGAGAPGKMQPDAIRLVAQQNSPELPIRGDLRIAVISDLNSGLGAADYEWQVDSIINRIPRLWKPDLVVSGGDMVAGMGVSDTAHLRRMWQGFDEHIAQPLRKANIPFAFTLGNHDGPRSYPIEQKAASEYWNDPAAHPGIEFVDRKHFPNYYSFTHDEVFFVSWEASSSTITEANLQWMEQQFQQPEAKAAKYRFVLGHMPLYSVAQERDSKGNVLNEPEKLRQLLEKYDVHTYISGHQHAYYPGKRGQLELLNTGAAGSGPRGWLTQNRSPKNTVTIMDIFYEKDSIAYTTYEIKEKAAGDMQLFDEKTLPSAMFGVNGHIIRRDLPVVAEVLGKLSSLHVSEKSEEDGTGEVTAVIENGKLIVTGNYSDLEGRILKNNGISLYHGRNSEEGKFLASIEPKSRRKKNGSFRASFETEEIMAMISGTEEAAANGNNSLTKETKKGTKPNGNGKSLQDSPVQSAASALPLSDPTADLHELLSVGAFYVSLETSEGLLRAQLLPKHNAAPTAPLITSHEEKNTYAVRDIEALYEIAWTKANDREGDFVSYTYQVARDRDFENLIYEEKTNRVHRLKKTEQFWFNLLGKADMGEKVALFHRVIASDGSNHTSSPAAALRLMKSDEPLDDFAEVQAPSYEFAGKIAQADGAGYGAEWDKQGKIWFADYRGKLIIKEKDGSEASFSPLKSVKVNSQEYSLNPINGIGVDVDGNILVGRNRHLLKIDAATGKGIAVWEVPEGGRAITSPRANENGEIYAMSLFGEDPNYILKQSKEDPSRFELLHTLHLEERILSRTFDMSSDGKTLYFPDPGSPLIQTYTSEDGISYEPPEKISSLAAGSSAIHVHEDSQLYSAVRSSGIAPSSIHFRDEAAQKMWTLELPEVNGAEPRGIGVSPDGKTIIFCSWDKGGGYYKYVLKE